MGFRLRFSQDFPNPMTQKSLKIIQPVIPQLAVNTSFSHGFPTTSQALGCMDRLHRATSWAAEMSDFSLFRWALKKWG